VESFPPEIAVVIACDVGALATPTESALDTLARLQLAARRLGATIRLYNASAALADLIAIAGLADVLVVVTSVEGDDGGGERSAFGPCVEVQRQAEQLERLGPDEEVLGGDEAV
jgi:hypothetical protein